MNRLNLCNGLYDHPTTCFVVANVICTSLPVRKRRSRKLHESGSEDKEREALFIIGVYLRSNLTLFPNRAMDVLGQQLPCTFRPSSFGFANRCR